MGSPDIDAKLNDNSDLPNINTTTVSSTFLPEEEGIESSDPRCYVSESS